MHHTWPCVHIPVSHCANRMQIVCISQCSLACAASSLTTLILHTHPALQHQSCVCIQLDNVNIAYAYSLTTCIVHVQQSCQCCCALQAKLDMFVAMQQLLQQSTGSVWSDFAGCSEKLVQIVLEHIGRYNKTCCLAPCVGFKRLRSLCTHHCIYSCLRLVGAHDCANHIALHMPQLSHCCIHHSKLSLSLTLDWKSQQTV